MTVNNQVDSVRGQSDVSSASVGPRAITPTEGAVIESGGHTAVYCASCQRWIDCHAGIAPGTALERHSALIH